MIEIGPAGVDQPGQLGLGRGHHLGVAMARVTDRDAGGEVQEVVAVRIGDPATQGFVQDQGVLPG